MQLLCRSLEVYVVRYLQFYLIDRVWLVWLVDWFLPPCCTAPWVIITSRRSRALGEEWRVKRCGLGCRRRTWRTGLELRRLLVSCRCWKRWRGQDGDWGTYDSRPHRHSESAFWSSHNTVHIIDHNNELRWTAPRIVCHGKTKNGGRSSQAALKQKNHAPS